MKDAWCLGELICGVTYPETCVGAPAEAAVHSCHRTHRRCLCSLPAQASRGALTTSVLCTQTTIILVSASTKDHATSIPNQQGKASTGPTSLPPRYFAAGLCEGLPVGMAHPSRQAEAQTNHKPSAGFPLQKHTYN